MSDTKICKTTVGDDSIEFAFSNGNTLSISTTSLSPSVVMQAALFGLRRKVANSFADAKGNVDEAFAAAKDTITQLTSGTWTVPREVSERAPRTSSDLIDAIVQLTGKTPEEVAGRLDEMTKEQRAALRRNEHVAAKLLEIRAERAKAKAPAMSVGDLFG